MAMMKAPTRKIVSTPPGWSTGSVPSLTWAGMNLIAISRANTAKGSVSRKGDPQEKCCKRTPARRGPSAVSAPPVAAQSAIDLVRAGPDQSAVISARVVG